jgi:hypothetical protein
LKRELGEDPARFLDAELASDRSRRNMVRDRIRGIDTVEVLRAWEAVERNLANRDGRDPREKVLEWLDQRADVLEEIGERPDRNVYPDEDPEPTESVAVFLDENGDERESRDTYYRSSWNRDRSASASASSDELAADGGERE